MTTSTNTAADGRTISERDAAVIPEAAIESAFRAYLASTGRASTIPAALMREMLAAAAPHMSQPIEIRAKPLEWQAHPEPPKSTSNWEDKQYMGFHIHFEPDEPDGKQYVAAWGEDDPEQFATLAEAQQWCQDEVDSWIRKNATVSTAPHMAPSVPDIYDAYRTWPADIRAKLSIHDLRRMSGWAPKPTGAWAIDTSAGTPILVYEKCSVIEDGQARYVLGLIAADMAPQPADSVARDAPIKPETVGPREKVSRKMVCDGCPKLVTKDWCDALENDETDIGTMATCEAAARTITAYWHPGDSPPTWCPAMADAPVAQEGEPR